MQEERKQKQEQPLKTSSGPLLQKSDEGLLGMGSYEGSEPNLIGNLASEDGDNQIKQAEANPDDDDDPNMMSD